MWWEVGKLIGRFVIEEIVRQMLGESLAAPTSSALDYVENIADQVLDATGGA